MILTKPRFVIFLIIGYLLPFELTLIIMKNCELSLDCKISGRKRVCLLFPCSTRQTIELSDNCLLQLDSKSGAYGNWCGLSTDAGRTWRPPWVIHQFGNEASDIGYPSSVALDKKGTLLTAFYSDYEPSCKKKPKAYRVLTMRWSLKDWLHPTILGSISDGKQLKL